MVNPDFFERLEHNPASITPKEYLVTGVATIKASMEQLPQHREKGTKWLMLGMALTTEGLRQIRTGDDFTEQERQRAALTVFLQPEIYQLPPESEAPLSKELQPTYAETLRGFLRETFYTLAAGYRSAVQTRIKELSDGFNYGNCELGAMLVLSRRDTPGTPIEEISFLDGFEKMTPEYRRMMSVAWARRLTPTMNDRAFAEVVGFFAKQDDMKAVAILTEAKLVGLPEPVGEHPVDFLAKIPWYRFD